MIPDLTFFILLGIIIAGCTILGIQYRRLSGKVDRILGGSIQSGDSVSDQLDIMRRVAKLEPGVESQDGRVRELEKTIQTNIQKIGFIRFNPFQDTGGDNSFILILLDGINNGVMISSLYMRDGMRIYAKAIEQGRSRHPMSQEEKKLLEETIKKNYEA